MRRRCVSGMLTRSGSLQGHEEGGTVETRERDSGHAGRTGAVRDRGPVDSGSRASARSMNEALPGRRVNETQTHYELRIGLERAEREAAVELERATRGRREVPTMKERINLRRLIAHIEDIRRSLRVIEKLNRQERVCERFDRARKSAFKADQEAQAPEAQEALMTNADHPTIEVLCAIDDFRAGDLVDVGRSSYRVVRSSRVISKPYSTLELEPSLRKCIYPETDANGVVRYRGGRALLDV